ncbi:hypothetical protein AB0H20_29230 [Nocardia fluminea]|jgi:hypothetical protein|uniref:hypothetical protein n=1 Tax=Nocardia fluminea TaxID=134984 RepID=UPI00340C05DB
MNSHPAHTWQIESRHRTSEGVVAYQRCRCGARRVVVDHLSVASEIHRDEPDLAAAG